MKVYKIFFPLTFILLLLLNAMLLRYSFWLGLLSGLVVGLHLFIAKKIASKFDFWAFSAVSGVYLVLLGAWLIFDILPLWITIQYTYITLTFLSLLFAVKNMEPSLKWWKKALRIGYAFGSVTLLAGTTLIMYFTIKPAVITKYFQAINSFAPQVVETPKYDEDKFKHTTNVKYGEVYPNSFMDIITIKDEDVHPLFFYIHGGGFVRGDKLLAHPANPSTSDYNYVSFNDILSQGFNVVTMNYAFAPEYLYPVQTYQASAALSFLLENAATYALDMNNIVISGESAGGFIGASFVSAQLNSEYATKIDLTPVLSKDQIKAMILESAILDPARAGKTQKTNLASDYIFQLATAGFLGTSAVSGDKKLLKDVNLVKYVNEDFPPTFITDGNNGTWPNQAREYSEVLKDKGVVSEVYIPGPELGVQGHVYFENVNNEATKTFLNKRKDFLNTHA